MTIKASAELVNNFVKLQGAVTEGIDAGLKKVGEHIVDLASQLAPEDTGELKNSGEYDVKNGNLEVSFGNGLADDRAIAQELGTIYMPAQPYLIPALREIDATLEIAKELRKKII